MRSAPKSKELVGAKDAFNRLIGNPERRPTAVIDQNLRASALVTAWKWCFLTMAGEFPISSATWYTFLYISL
jgi:hypothetical protein